ncbi:pyridoxal phosphate-dependent aminotransferase [Pelobacter propionicus]|uniref:Aminotransferase n=1 Tax=Pelobacter propionicus (strain DSM 2379 / NBRC 103807 / OttBd1) TaxID=338966 RepID=A1AML6_PELPD|nr:pyridoxal phosphate-dependent aminotransferase [Pelobacter propionicus]ABK98586.1 aminotransferase [Pelobacter propionicus DSM 2379]
MIPERVDRMTSFIVMDVLEKAQEMERAGIDVIHLEVGEPDFGVPECVSEAISRAVRDGHTHYTHSLGMVELREAICEHYGKNYGVAVHPDQVVVTSGTSPAMLSMFSTLLAKGDEVIISDPHYACYPNFIQFLEGKVVKVPVCEDDGFQYRPEAIRDRITERTRAILINSPSNPTGTVLSAERMWAIAQLGPYCISDEIYHGLNYHGSEHTILEFTDHAFVLNGFSKIFAMTGLRLGYLIAPPCFIRPLQKLQQNFFLAPNSVAQIGGIAALKEADADVLRMRNTYDQRRRFMIQRLRDIGFGIPVEPTGAFYVFANAKHLSGDSYALAYDILEKARVGVTPGIDFGQGGEGYLRFTYANSLENIAEGLSRLERYVAERTC